MNVIYLYLSKKKTLTEPFCRRDVNFNFNLRRIITFRNLVQSYFVSSFKPVLHFNTFSKNLPLAPSSRQLGWMYDRE